MKNQMPAYFKILLADHTAPCISMYLATRRAALPAGENSRRLGELINRACEQLLLRYPGHKTDLALEPFIRLAEDDSFWRHPADALAIFSSPDIFQVVKLDRPVRDYAEVADSFHLKPLIRTLQFSGRLQVLCLCQRRVTMWEGDRDHLEPLDRKGVPANIFDALGLRPAGDIADGDESRIHAVSGSMDLERFFRIIDKSVWANHSRYSGLPLMLCALHHYHDLFHKISRNPYLMAEGVKLDPASLDAPRLRQEVWKVIEPYYQRQIGLVIDEYNLAKAHRQGSDDISQVAQAVASARVGTLLVDADKHVAGRIDPASGAVQFGELQDPRFDDLLDDMAERVIKTGGQVLVMAPEQMPSKTGLAAIYRY